MKKIAKVKATIRKDWYDIFITKGRDGKIKLNIGDTEMLIKVQELLDAIKYVSGR